jgi:hypothetical protein
MPHEPTPETLAIELPFGVWLTVEETLRNQRYTSQRWLAQKTAASDHARLRAAQIVVDLTKAIDKIVDRTSSV